MAPRIVVEEQSRRPWLRWVIAGLVAVLVCLLLWGGYGLALSVAGGDWARMRARAESLAGERDQLEQAAAQMERENQRLREQLTFTERSAEIDQRACSTAVSYTSLTLPTNREVEVREAVLAIISN